ncbi:MAG: hypothetical protein ACFBWO_04795 [Paracoccaceae bacterium]
MLAGYTQVFMPALGGFVVAYFPLFLLGAVFGRLMDDSVLRHRTLDRRAFPPKWPVSRRNAGGRRDPPQAGDGLDAIARHRRVRRPGTG